MTDQILMKRMKPCGMFFFVCRRLAVGLKEGGRKPGKWLGWRLVPFLAAVVRYSFCQNGMEYRIQLPALKPTPRVFS